VEACSFQHALPRFEGIDAVVLGVSPDSARKHARFKKKFGLAYPLVADTDHAICERYGVWAEKTFFGRKYWGVNRTTFVIDAEGRIAKVFEQVNPLGHASEVADAVATLG
jgi:thioredoxin-dependent peroxiredoxin